MCNVLCGYRFLERTTLLVLSECLSISHIIAMQLFCHELPVYPPFKQDYHSRQVLNNCINMILLLQVSVMFSTTMTTNEDKVHHSSMLHTAAPEVVPVSLPHWHTGVNFLRSTVLFDTICTYAQ